MQYCYFYLSKVSEYILHYGANSGRTFVVIYDSKVVQYIFIFTVWCGSCGYINTEQQLICTQVSLGNQQFEGLLLERFKRYI